MSLFHSEERPRLPVQWLPVGIWEWLLEAAALGIVLFWVYYLPMHWEVLPERVPSGFGGGGLPRGWASKSFLWLLPAVSLALYLIMTVASRYPHMRNFTVQVTEANARRLYAIARQLLILMKLESVGMMGYVEWKMIQTGRGEVTGLDPQVMWTLIAAMLGTALFGVIAMRRVDRELRENSL